MAKVLQCDLCKRVYPDVIIDRKVKFKEKVWSGFWDHYVWKTIHICEECSKTVRAFSRKPVVSKGDKIRKMSNSELANYFHEHDEITKEKGQLSVEQLYEFFNEGLEE